MEIKTLPQQVRKLEEDDRVGETIISKYVSWSLRETVEKIDAYLNSKHTSGETDSLGREKPFFNVVTAACNIWFRATDIDRKNIKIKATKEKDFIPSFLMTILMQEWMRKNFWGTFLNEWGRVLARYGSAVLKFVEKKGELISEVIPWNRILCDPIDFDNNMVVEKLWLTPAQLRKNKNYDQDMVEKLLDNLQMRQTSDLQKKDTKSEYIPIYEVHGELPVWHLKDEPEEEDKKEYAQQMNVITFLTKKDKRGEFDDYSLYKGREKNPYLITHLIKEDGRTLAIGAVEHLFDVQWMTNHTAKQMKDQLDLASKIIFQTSDGNFVNQNVLTAIENGQILVHKTNEPLTQINNKADITALIAYGNMWRSVGFEQTGISESMMGQNPPSGTAWRQTEALLAESRSLFELMTENKGLAIEEMMRKFIIPFFKKQIDTSKEVMAILEAHQIKQLDSMYIPNETIRRVNQKKINTILSGRVYDPMMEGIDTAMAQQSLQAGLNKYGNQRPIKPSDISSKTWKEMAKDLEWELEVDVTAEESDTQAVLTTLTTTLQYIVALNGRPMTPEEKLLFNRILEKTKAVSPIELNMNNNQSPAVQPVPQQMPVQAQTGGGIMAKPNA